LDKVSESVGVLDANFRFIGNDDSIHLDEVSQELDRSAERSFVRCWEWETIEGDFEDRQGGRPYVRVDPVHRESIERASVRIFDGIDSREKQGDVRVLTTSNPFGRQVEGCADEGSC